MGRRQSNLETVDTEPREVEKCIRARFRGGEDLMSVANEYGIGTRTAQRIVGDLEGEDHAR